jgi:hypothetical protein
MISRMGSNGCGAALGGNNHRATRASAGTIGRLATFLLFFTWMSSPLIAQPRPNIVITRAETMAMRAAAGRYPLFDSTHQRAVRLMDRALATPIDVPLPVDAGGYTHERHKQNYTEMQAAGVLYAVTGGERYARFIRDMLLLYAELYPALGTHPGATSVESSGRLFWQTLNESVWLVHAAQAYDCVYDWLNPADRTTIERQLLRPMARFFMEDHAREHDRIHNHGTWMVAATGMLGYALRDADMVEKALTGTDKKKTGGFLRQLDLLFSPDGYYREGPYYTRYALMPFFLFAHAIDNNQPERKIFAYRDGILKKAFVAAIQQTTPAGRFIPFNDALKEMDVTAKEVVTVMNIAWLHYAGERGWLDVARRQKNVMFSGAGLAVARDLGALTPIEPFPYCSVEFRDGPAGTGGGIGILRTTVNDEQSLLVMKYASQGMGHGHFDRLGFSYYEQESEVIPDYGSARFINVEPKFGGRYLPENTSWAKQTIAHNTLVVDGRSQFGGSVKRGEDSPGRRHFFAANDPDLQIMSACEDSAYPGVRLQRTMAMVRDQRFRRPVILDVITVDADQRHEYDLPFYYQGHLVNTTVRYRALQTTVTSPGESDGYQHLWIEAAGPAAGGAQWTWLLGGRYYSITSAADSATQVLFARIGAGDSSFNLRHETAVILRHQARSCVFASVIEPHGLFEPVEEVSLDALPVVQRVTVQASTSDGTVVEISGKKGLNWQLMIARGDPSVEKEHRVQGKGVLYVWKGSHALVKTR